MKTKCLAWVTAAAAATALGACSGEPGGEPAATGMEQSASTDGFVDDSNLEFGTNAHLLLRHAPGDELHMAAKATPAAASTPHLTYYGGPVISNVHVVKVEYGAGTYQSFVTGTGNATMAGFYTGVPNSTYMDWLSEYDTSTQKIGRGTYGGNYSITPASTRDKSTISDTNIQAEISAQITAGHLPAPTANTLYMVHFPKGKTISQGGSKSCVAGGFCAYHGTFKRNGQYVYYGVLPDMSSGSGCDVGCGNGSAFGNQTSVASHEMTEAVTDAAVGLATTLGSPLAWYDNTNGEIGDICNAEQGSITGGNGATYTVQKEWSNSSNACIVHK